MCGDAFLSLPANKEDAVGDDVQSETFCSTLQTLTEGKRGEMVTGAMRELLAVTSELKLSVENKKKKKKNLFLEASVSIATSLLLVFQLFHISVSINIGCQYILFWQPRTKNSCYDCYATCTEMISTVEIIPSDWPLLCYISNEGK